MLNRRLGQPAGPAIVDETCFFGFFCVRFLVIASLNFFVLFLGFSLKHAPAGQISQSSVYLLIKMCDFSLLFAFFLFFCLVCLFLN